MSILVQNRLKFNKNYIIEKNTELKDKRCYFIANRVVISQIVLLLLTGILAFSIVQLGLAEMIGFLWVAFLLVIPIFGVIFTYMNRKSFYYNHHWIVGFFPLALIWLSFTGYVGVYIDYFHGAGKTFWVGIFLSLYYIIGYYISRIIRKIRFSYSKASILKIFFLSSIVLIVGTLIVGFIILDFSMKANNIKSLYWSEYGQFSGCFNCALGIFIMLSGLGVFISTLMNYWMLYLLYENKSWNVEIDSPNRLYLSCLSRTLICMTLFWIFMESFIPPIASKKGRSGRRRSSGRSSRIGGSKKESVMLSTQTKKQINQEWNKHHLGDPNQEDKKLTGG